jgi:hypothetical protein
MLHFISARIVAAQPGKDHWCIDFLNQHRVPPYNILSTYDKSRISPVVMLLTTFHFSGLGIKSVSFVLENLLGGWVSWFATKTDGL